MSQMAYSDLKAAWHTSRIDRLRAGEQIVPAQVQLILSDLCNQDCHFCAYRMSGGFSTEQFRGPSGERNPSRMIPYDKAREILDDCAALGVGAIQFTGGGEPTVHPQHMELFRHALDLGLECGLVTNGVILREGWQDVLPRFEWIRVSLDAGTAGTYARVRNTNPKLFARALDHAQSLAEATDHGLVGLGYVVTLENWGELLAACGEAASRGIPYVRVSAMFSSEGSGYYGEKLPEILRSIDIVKSKFREDLVVDLFSDRIADLDQGAPDYEFCGYQQFNMYIGGNLKVYRCCTTSYTAHGEVGDLSDMRLRDWFASPEKQSAYNCLDARSCHTCQFNGKNRSIGYLLKARPMHVNFV